MKLLVYICISCTFSPPMSYTPYSLSPRTALESPDSSIIIGLSPNTNVKIINGWYKRNNRSTSVGQNAAREDELATVQHIMEQAG